MSDDRSARLALPLLAAGQAQKELTHNDALALLDLLVQPAVQAAGLDAPPADAVAGQCWIVGPAPTGDWAGQAMALAAWTASGWRFAPPLDGMAVWIVSDRLQARFVAGAWTAGTLAGHHVEIDGIPVVGPQSAAIAAPAGGAMIDAEARSAIFAMLAALRSHGLIAT